jgi:hypothetical protein
LTLQKIVAIVRAIVETLVSVASQLDLCRAESPRGYYQL